MFCVFRLPVILRICVFRVLDHGGYPETKTGQPPVPRPWHPSRAGRAAVRHTSSHKLPPASCVGKWGKGGSSHSSTHSLRRSSSQKKCKTISWLPLTRGAPIDTELILVRCSVVWDFLCSAPRASQAHRLLLEGRQVGEKAD